MSFALKTVPLTIASFLAAASIFGKERNQGGSCAQRPAVSKSGKCCVPQAPQDPTMRAYNAPAEINTGCQGDIDIFATGSFLYWQTTQDNMDIGLTDADGAVLLGSNAPPPPPVHSITGNYIEMHFPFHPGFKAGLGVNLQRDHWDGYAEYTRVHGTSRTSSNGPVKDSNSLGPVPAIFSTFGHPFFQAITKLGGQLFNTVSAKYRSNLDFIDAELGRTYYVGRSLIFRSAFGMRGALIQQNIHVQYRNIQTGASVDATTELLSLPSVLDVFQNSHSWAVGPRTGVVIDWMFSPGFRFFGTGYGDLLYTKYHVRDKSTVLPLFTSQNALLGVPTGITTNDRPIGLRTHLDFEMGLGWGAYFDRNSLHIDISASYGWQVFFDQNMFRQYSSVIIGDNTLPHGNLYVQGLTATARVDF